MKEIKEFLKKAKAKICKNCGEVILCIGCKKCPHCGWKL